MKSSKGQSSIEFFTLVGLAFLTAIFFMTASANEAREFRDKKDFFLIKDVALKLQKEATIAASVEKGYARNFTLPDKLENFLDYSMTVGNTTITVNTSKTLVILAIPKVNGSFTKGSNKIENLDGRVYVNRQ